MASSIIDARAALGSHDVLLVTLDTLRYDVAVDALRHGRTPFLASILPHGWEERHTPGNFTFAAHAAFFAGFLPTPVQPGKHPRPFALRFPGSETIAETTAVFDAPDIVTGFASAGYHTLCVGGVGFFNKLTPLGSLMPGLFAESIWRPEFGVTDPHSTGHQVEWIIGRIRDLPADRRLFLFFNIAAIHQPNCFYLRGVAEDTIESHAAALAYVDCQLPPLFAALQARAPLLAILGSDHGTAYGEDGYVGHRLGHPVVWTVPYAEVVLPRET